MGGTATSSGLWGGFVEELLVADASVAVLLGFFFLVGLRARLEGGATGAGSVPSGLVLDEVRVVTAMVGLVFYLDAE